MKSKFLIVPKHNRPPFGYFMSVLTEGEYDLHAQGSCQIFDVENNCRMVCRGVWEPVAHLDRRESHETRPEYIEL